MAAAASSILLQTPQLDQHRFIFASTSSKAASHVLMINTTQQHPPLPLPLPLPIPSAASFRLLLLASRSSRSGFARTRLGSLSAGGRPAALKRPSRCCLTRRSHDRLHENPHCCGVCEVHTRPAPVSLATSNSVFVEPCATRWITALSWCAQLLLSAFQSGAAWSSQRIPATPPSSKGPTHSYSFRRRLKVIHKSKDPTCHIGF